MMIKYNHNNIMKFILKFVLYCKNIFYKRTPVEVSGTFTCVSTSAFDGEINFSLIKSQPSVKRKKIFKNNSPLNLKPNVIDK